MFAYVRENIVLDTDERDNIVDCYHPDILKDYIPCPDTVKIGDQYKNGDFIPQEVGE